MHDGLASLLAKGSFKVLSIVLGQEVAGDRLSTVLVDSLKDLVAGGVTQTGEKGNKFAAKGCAGLVLEDDLVQLARICDLKSYSVSATVASHHRCRTLLTRVWLLISRLAIVSTYSTVSKSQAQGPLPRPCPENAQGGRWPARQYQRSL